MRALSSALLDNRSSIDEIPLGSFRQKLNFAVDPDGRLARAKGWQRFYKSDVEGNWDLHDQGVSVADREPPTLLFASVSNDGVRRLIEGTKRRLRVLDETAGTWAVIGSGFGADGNDSLTQVRFHAAELQNRVIFTNDFDPVQIYTLGDAAVAPLADLSNVDNEIEGNDDGSGLTKAKVVVEFNGFIFLMNTFEGGVRIKNRIRWCHLNVPTAWEVGATITFPGGDAGTSVADYQDLGGPEEILAALPRGGFMWVFTNQSIWRCTISVNLGNATVTPAIPPGISLTCNKVYSDPKTQAKCLAYPNAIVSTGDAFYYAGREAIWSIDDYNFNNPDRVDWIHRATGIVYKAPASRINKNACESPIMEFRPATNDDDSAGAGEIYFSWPSTETDLNDRTLVCNTRAKTCDERDFGASAIVNFRKQTPGACNQQVGLIIGLSADFALKEADIGNSREMYNAATNTYSIAGYYSRLIWTFPFERFDINKILNGLLVERTPEDENDTAVFRLRIGTAGAALDPAPTNGGRCAVIWRQLKDEKIKCRMVMTAEQYKAKNIAPHNPARWHFHYEGRYLFAELTVAAANGSAPTTGGVSISHMEVEAALGSK